MLVKVYFQVRNSSIGKSANLFQSFGAENENVDLILDTSRDNTTHTHITEL